MKDKQYLISEEELRKLVNDAVYYPLETRDIDVDNFLKSKKPVDTLDRDNVEKIMKSRQPIYDECPYCGYKNENIIEGRADGITMHIKKRHSEKYVDKIDQVLSLIPPPISEDKIREIIDNLLDNLESTGGDIKKFIELKEYTISQLSALVKPEQATPEKIREIIGDVNNYIEGDKRMVKVNQIVSQLSQLSTKSVVDNKRVMKIIMDRVGMEDTGYSESINYIQIKEIAKELSQLYVQPKIDRNSFRLNSPEIIKKRKELKELRAKKGDKNE